MRCRDSLLFAMCVILLGSGCGKEVPHIAQITPDSKVLAFGDSLTRGTGASKKQSYPSVLAGLIGCSVINCGVPGELTSDGLRRLPSILAKHRPDLVILCHGGNDLIHSHDASEVAENLAAMIELVQGRGADVILLGVPKPGLRLKTASFYEDVAEEYNVLCDSRVVTEVLSSSSSRSDHAHPNARGYKRMAAAVAKLIESASTQ
ncbi:MAG: GDSL-type esterase/lipase family protein [Kiritimatiellia bacterium]|nr:GDSL-type esterase/lipase family protein [Kiritimatiellia bacterium]MDP6848761.1 GDSL-type esterase/lipase family protein [Kiritimatiellia bacterium]